MVEIKETSRSSRFTEKVRVALFVGVTLVVFALLVGCDETYPPSIVEIGAREVYPGATEVVTHEMRVAWRSPGIEQYRTVDFHTSDAPDVVLGYFRKTLLDRGWAISGCQGAEGSLTFVWVFPYSSAMEIVEVNAGADSQLRFAHYVYKGGSYYVPDPIEELKEAGLTKCLGVYNAKTDTMQTIGYIALVVVVLVWLLHLKLVAVEWSGAVGLLWLRLIGTIIFTAVCWLLIGVVIVIIAGFVYFPGRFISLPREDPITIVVAELVFRVPLLAAAILVGLTGIGVLIKEPLKQARLRKKIRSSTDKGE